MSDTNTIITPQKPIVSVWITESGLRQLRRGNVPSEFFTQPPKNYNKELINVFISSDAYLEIRQYEKDLDLNDLPF